MLWYKAWRETRWRALIPLVMAVYALSQVHLRTGPAQSVAAALRFLSVLWMLAPMMLAGSGVRTEPVFQPVKGLHGSMYFTLSLPVSRFRLFAARVGVGMLETAAIILPCSVAAGMLPELSGHVSIADAFRYGLTVLLCGTGFFGLSTLLSAFLEQLWQIWGSMGAVLLTPLLFNTIGLPQSLNVLRAMGNSSPLVTHTMPWPAIGVSLGVAAIFLLAALKVVQTREY